MPSPGQPVIMGGIGSNYSLVKKKTVSPRNQSNTSGIMNSQSVANAGGPKMLLMADKNQHLLELAQGKPQVSEDFKGSMVTTSDLQDSNSKNKNRLKNNHYNLPNSKNGPEIIDNADINGKPLCLVIIQVFQENITMARNRFRRQQTSSFVVK